ncbi:MAG: pyruvate dehydrogenase (acetyl-transferring) E1 component subunit alpha [Alphaproteobacteria bacterium]|uniref:Pyruvate dehydrogenase E1 component subunit alpha n=1 Tax=Candidatus Nitrobium versatile TaxID=2884831 RepID=A0A953M167_9BACT|nr:pyruvate dehydrogenase (acetyl-transferring) E1 component subunit alpha [Candidatus Nitrobium versatile]
MPEKTIESITVRRLDILDEQGNADASLLPPLSAEEIKRMYALLVLARTFDQRALSLQREGRIGTYASILGQEAAQVGSALALGKSDWVFPSFRETGVYLTMGYPAHQLFQYWGGDERGMIAPQGLNIFPISIPVGTQIPHAVGAAMAAKYRKDPIVVISYFGDGGTSKGDFHEGFTMAGVFRAPVVFLCQNNQWAISVPRERQTASKTLAQKAYAYGFEGVQVDGNDIFAVYSASRDALEKARSGGGPTFIECFTYRMSHHTTADDATRYRQESEVEEWKAKDPLLRLKRYMEKQGFWTEQYQREAEEEAKKTVDGAVKTAEAVPPPHPKDMILSTYAELTPRQAKEIKDF